MASGIYTITNRVNGKRYVGQAGSFRDRWLHHKSTLRRGVHGNRHLQSAWIKHGEAAFSFEVLELVPATDEAMCAREQHWIDTLQPEYNIAPVAGTTRGVKHPPRTPEFCERMREMKTGFRHTPESIERMRQIPGRPHSEETRRKLAARDISYLHSPESVAKRREKMVGRTWAPEVVEKRRMANVGRKRTPEQCKRIADAKRAAYSARIAAGGQRYVSPMKGKKHAEESKRKNAESKRGKPNGRGSLTQEQVREVRRLHAEEGIGKRRIANRMNIKPAAAFAVIHGLAYTWVI